MKVEYEFKETHWVGMCVIWGVVLMFFPLLAYTTAIDLEESIRYGETHMYLWITPVIVVLLMLNGAVGSSLTQLRLKAYPEFILISHGPHWFSRPRIAREEIVAIQAMPEAAIKYFGRLGIFKYPRFPLPGWRGYICTTKRKGLAIETEKIKYMVSCPNAEEAAEKLREIYGIAPTTIDPPPLV